MGYYRGLRNHQLYYLLPCFVENDEVTGLEMFPFCKRCKDFLRRGILHKCMRAYKNGLDNYGYSSLCNCRLSQVEQNMISTERQFMTTVQVVPNKPQQLPQSGQSATADALREPEHVALSEHCIQFAVSDTVMAVSSTGAQVENKRLFGNRDVQQYVQATFVGSHGQSEPIKNVLRGTNSSVSVNIKGMVEILKL